MTNTSKRSLHECPRSIEYTNELRKRDKMGGLPNILSLFCNELNKFNNEGARVLDSMYSYDIKITYNIAFLM